MASVLGAVLFLFVTVMTLLAVCGLPLGEFTMGGRHRVLPVKYRLIGISSLIVQIFAIIIILQAGEIIPLWFSPSVTKYVCMFFAAYLSLNTVMNFFSQSKKERLVMTPLAFTAAVCFWICALAS